MESKVSVEFKENNLEVATDFDLDGQKSLKLKIKSAEALAEIIKKGDALPEAKIVSLAFEGSKLVLKVDTDKDGETSIELEVDLPEVFTEVVK